MLFSLAEMHAERNHVSQAREVYRRILSSKGFRGEDSYRQRARAALAALKRR